MSAAELRMAAEALRERAKAATPGPWERGDHWHIQGAKFCRCDPEWGPAQARRMDINGTVMDAHIHRLPEGASWMHGIYSATQARGGYYPCVVNDTDEYDYMADEDATYIATMHPGVGLALADWLDSVARVDLGRGQRETHEACDDDCDVVRALAVARIINGGV